MTDSQRHFEQHICIDTTDHLNNGIKITENYTVEQLIINSQLSKRQIKQAMSKGAVWLSRGNNTQRIRRIKKPLQHGDTLHLYYDENILAQQPSPAVLINDQHGYSIWYKPYGMHCQGSKWGDHCTIHRWAEKQLQRPTWLVHRLDRATTGLIILAHTKKYAAALAEQFRQRKVKKYYRARVHGQFPNSQLPKTLNNEIDGKTATSHVNLITYLKHNNQSIVSIQIDTGRKHQIRRHLAGIGYPVVGDRMYSEKIDTVDLQLCSWSLEFSCPVNHTQKNYNLTMLKLPGITNYLYK